MASNDGNDGDEASLSMANEENNSRAVFEEERKALLNGMATKLQSVIQRMSEINKRLKENSKDSESVSTLSELWQQSYMISHEVRRNDESNSRVTESSLFVPKKNQS